MNKLKAKQILNILSPDGTAVDFKSFDDEVAKLKGALKEKIQVKTLDDVSTKLEIFKKSLDLSPLQKSVAQIKTNLDNRIAELDGLIEQKIKDSIPEDDDSQQISDIAELKAEIEILRNKKEDLSPIFDDLKALKQARTKIYNSIDDLQKKSEEDDRNDLKVTEELTNKINDLRKDLLNRINNIHGGGNMNRKEMIGGVDVLKKYTDINWKAGANTTITYANNETLKTTDITITATGGSGGTVRSINSISTPQTAGATAGTDYVYLISGTTQITMPTAVGNSNLYTIKNVGVGTVTIATTGVETIDGNLTITMPVQFTSVDLISDSLNWNIT
jgi:hypothetical protein